MRKIILQLAVSLDGLIEGPNGEYDWCFTDQDYGMNDFYKRIDTIFMGRKTYEMSLAINDNTGGGFPKIKTYVLSNTLKKLTDDSTLIGGDVAKRIGEIKKEKGKDIWLFCGASLTGFLMNEKLIDEIVLAVHPVILGSGKALFSNIKTRINLTLTDTRTYPSGLVMLTYTLN
jgi:dihydrofolate reductase